MAPAARMTRTNRMAQDETGSQGYRGCGLRPVPSRVSLRCLLFGVLGLCLVGFGVPELRLVLLFWPLPSPWFP